jgi:hypothetical protein
MDDTLRTFVEAAEAQGWRVERTNAKHLRFVPPDRTKPIVHTAGTPHGGKRGYANIRSDLRRAGLVLP